MVLDNEIFNGLFYTLKKNAEAEIELVLHLGVL